MAKGWDLCQGSARDYHILRRLALSLAFWPTDADLDWSWIKGAENLHMGEMRIGETIAGNNNLRIIFFKANRTLADDPQHADGEIMHRIWLLTIIQKKRQELSANQVAAWRGMRTIIVQRHYDGRSDV
jgi:hypothetical protein